MRREKNALVNTKIVRGMSGTHSTISLITALLLALSSFCPLFSFSSPPLPALSVVATLIVFALASSLLNDDEPDADPDPDVDDASDITLSTTVGLLDLASVDVDGGVGVLELEEVVVVVVEEVVTEEASVAPEPTPTLGPVEPTPVLPTPRSAISLKYAITLLNAFACCCCNNNSGPGTCKYCPSGDVGDSFSPM